MRPRTLSLFGGPATLDPIPTAAPDLADPTPKPARTSRNRAAHIDLFADFASAELGADPISGQTALVFGDGAR